MLLKYVLYFVGQAFVSKAEYVTPLTNAPAAPPLVVMSLNLRTLPNPKTHQNEVSNILLIMQTTILQPLTILTILY